MMAHSNPKLTDSTQNPNTWSTIESSVLELEFDPSRLSDLLEAYNHFQIPPNCQSLESKCSNYDDEADLYHDQAVEFDAPFDSVHNFQKLRKPMSCQNIQTRYHFSSLQVVEQKQCSSEPSANGFVSTGTTTSGDKMMKTTQTCKQRMKWTQNLHEQFVGCVNILGGAEKATPRAILKMMDSEMLTIFHVKSHLQKYRTSKQVEESKQEKLQSGTITANENGPMAEKLQTKITTANEIGPTQLDMKIGMQIIMESVHLVNSHLQKQLEIQRSLLLRVEEQEKQLGMIFQDLQAKRK